MAFTFFFRDLDTLELAVDRVVQNVMGRSRVRVWDAGCATGQEPYTLAVLLAERMGQFAFRNLEIHASDYDAPLLEVVRNATYAASDVQRVPVDLLARYWEQVNAGEFRLNSTIRNALRVRQHDLLSYEPFRTDFSLVVCKNVMLHFQPEQRLEVIKMFHRALEPGGLLVTEHTQKMPNEAADLFEHVARVDQVFRKREVVLSQ